MAIALDNRPAMPRMPGPMRMGTLGLGLLDVQQTAFAVQTFSNSNLPGATHKLLVPCVLLYPVANGNTSLP